MSNHALTAKLSEVARSLSEITRELRGLRVDATRNSATITPRVMSIPVDRVKAITGKQILALLEDINKEAPVFEVSETTLGWYARHKRGFTPNFLILSDDDEELLYLNRVEIIEAISSAVNWNTTVTLRALEQQSSPLERLANCA